MGGRGRGLINACAYVVGDREGPGAALTITAGQLGFAPVLAYGGLAAAERQAGETPVCFFLFSEVDDPTSIRSTAEAIRFCPRATIRFSPLIYFCKNPSRETLAACMAMGFDDVIALPMNEARLKQRVMGHLDGAVTYFETSSYFGPDRRRNLKNPSLQAERRKGGHYRLMEIRRSAAKGVAVLRDEFAAEA
jgi:hypothetical protein